MGPDRSRRQWLRTTTRSDQARRMAAAFALAEHDHVSGRKQNFVNYPGCGLRPTGARKPVSNSNFQPTAHSETKTRNSASFGGHMTIVWPHRASPSDQRLVERQGSE